jgi:hypothetical protein
MATESCHGAELPSPKKLTFRSAPEKSRQDSMTMCVVIGEGGRLESSEKSGLVLGSDPGRYSPQHGNPAGTISSRSQSFPGPPMSVADELLKLQQLRDAGAITPEEFERQKAALMDPKPALNLDVKQWSVLLHLSQLLNLVTGFGGIIAPIVIWMLFRDQSPEIDQHGKNIVNWWISSLIYGVVSGLLCLVLIGIPLLIALVILTFVFPIIGAIKASSGEVWRYPMTINFIK